MRGFWFVMLLLAVVLAVAMGCGKPGTATGTSGPDTGAAVSAPLPMTLAALTSDATSATAAASVTIKDFTFRPALLTVTAGTEVTWTNQDSITHTATGEDWDSGTLKPGQSWSHVFDAPGTYNYRCSEHPDMKGTVTVTPATGGYATSGEASATPEGSATPAAKSGSEPTAQVEISGMDFHPHDLTVAVGTRVIWTNHDHAKHSVTGQGFDSGNMGYHHVFTHVFDKPGRYQYHCKDHGWMKGAIIAE